MILHKENTNSYEPFYKLLQDYKNISETGEQELILVTNPEKHDGINLVEKYSHMFQNLISFENEVRSISSPSQLAEKLKLSLKRILPVKDASLLFFDESLVSLKAIGAIENDLPDRMNHYYKEGILNILFEGEKSMILPELNSYNSDGAKLNYIIFPFFENTKKKGLLCILSSIVQKNFNNLDRQIIQVLLNVALAKIDKLFLRSKLNSTIEELQTYQAKLSNDFRLAAIGELTEGIIEDISTPLQVIMSNVDLIDVSDDDQTEVKKIKQQVRKINSSMNRLVKFSNLNQKNIKIQPCNFNNVLNEYYNLVKSTLESVNLEFVLDFDEDLPSILSHPNYIFQILTNVIGLIKTNSKGNGGIIIQTRYISDDVVLKLVSTAELKSYSKLLKNDSKNSDLNIKIIESLMNKHEGSFEVESFQGGGSTITLKFPLKRKIRK
ncbi:MAG: hypothetical protein JEY94_16360 [Melioribacteraceae bacterium]|nr:hypothetical protein [Melioribacteraceae bacterium]